MERQNQAGGGELSASSNRNGLTHVATDGKHLSDIVELETSFEHKATD
jgi:hypothetical protein